MKEPHSNMHSERERPDIRALTQHFNQPGGGIEPWLFVPASNIAEVSTAEHPGTATIRQAGRGEDIKGILRRPIGIGDYPLPWEFQMSLVQNPMAALLGVGDLRQNNTAIGLNVALTFSDPSTWPADRTQRPPDTHDFQLLVIHLGNTGEFGAGLPQFAPYRTPETHLVWGRGDLAPTLNGDWKIPYFFQGSMPDAGPASPQVFFRFHLSGSNTFSVGIKFNDWNEFYMRSVDCSRFGKITGVWEIGPIFSCDRWIPTCCARNCWCCTRRSRIRPRRSRPTRSTSSRWTTACSCHARPARRLSRFPTSSTCPGS